MRYELKSSAKFDPKEITHFAQQAMHPVEYHPVVNAHDPVFNGKLIELQGEGVVLLQMKPAEDNDDIIVRVTNYSQRSQHAKLSLPNRSIEAASTCDTLEQPTKPLPCEDNQISWSVQPSEISSVRLSVKL